MIELPNTMKILEEAAKDSAALVAAAVPKVSGRLQNSIRTEVRNEDNHLQVVLVAEDYLQYISEGTQPGSWPPPAPILEWVEKKPIIPYANKDGSIPTAKQLAFLICRKIYREGITPRHYFDIVERNAEKWRAQIVETFEQESKTILNNTI